MPDFAALSSILRLATQDRKRLVLENIALRHQLAVYKRSIGRPNINDRDRIFWLTVMRMLREWRDALVIVQPATVIQWHRNGLRHYWRRKSRSKPDRPPTAMAVIMLIRRMSSENVTWGAPRIRDELALLGHDVAISTVAKYMVRRREPEPNQAWATVLRNHMTETAACDFFVVPTVVFQRLFCFVVMSLDRRKLLHVHVTRHPTAEWVAQQMLEAFPGDGWVPRFLQRDREGAYGWAFRRRLKAMGIDELVSAPRSPWQNPFVERLIGSTRRECTDHIIPMAEMHLLRTVSAYATYYNTSRPHQSLDGNAPSPRAIEGVGDVVAMPVLGGLHHRYSRAAWTKPVIDPWRRCIFSSTGRFPLNWNGEKMTFPGRPDADVHLRPNIRQGWMIDGLWRAARGPVERPAVGSRRNTRGFAGSADNAPREALSSRA